MKDSLLLVGGGGHARSLLNAGFDVNIRGYLDLHPVDDMPIDYWGTDEDYFRDDALIPMPLHIAVVSGPDCTMALRRRIIDIYRGYEYVTLIAPTSEIAPGSSIGSGSALMRGCIVNGAILGKHCVINTGAIVEHDVKIGENVFIGPGVVICGGVTIGDDCYIGAGAIVRNGVSIVSGTTAGMGSVVINDITQAGIYAGNPCKRIK